MQRCWETGLDGASVPEMTPSEVKGMIEADRAKTRANDRAAWRAGHYTAFACNAPKKYPRKPFSEAYEARNAGRPMTDKEMLTVLLHMKERTEHADNR